MDGSSVDERTITARFHTGTDFRTTAKQTVTPSSTSTATTVSSRRPSRGNKNSKFLDDPLLMLRPKTAIREQEESESETTYWAPVRAINNADETDKKSDEAEP